MPIFYAIFILMEDHKFQIGELVAINDFSGKIFGIIIDFKGFYDSKVSNKKREVYEVLVGKERRYINEVLIEKIK